MKEAPKDLESAQQIIAGLTSELGSFKQLVLHQKTEITFLQDKVKLLTFRQYAKKAERLVDKDSPQLGLFDEAKRLSGQEAKKVEEADKALNQPNANQSASTKKKTKAINPDLPREDVTHELAKSEQVCDCCDSPLKLIGYDETEQLDIIPAKYRILRNKVAKYACSKFEEHGVKRVAVDKQPIRNSIATANTLAHVLASKYQHHLPLYRQEQILQDIGIEIPRSTMSHWSLKSAELLKPLYEQMRQSLIESSYLHIDDTRVTVLTQNYKDPKQNKNGQKVKQGYMWVMGDSQKNQQAVLYHYSDSRAGKVPQELLEGFNGHIQADAYAGHKALFTEEETQRTSVGCWAHARRKFYEIAEAAPDKEGMARNLVNRIQLLYKVESELKKAKALPDKIKQTRQQKSKPILKDI